MKITQLILLLVFFPALLFSQSTHTVSGQLNETNGDAMPFANVLLLKLADSTLVKGTVTNDDGSYILENIKTGNHIVMVSMVGYQSTYSQAFDLRADYKVETLILSAGESLEEVVVEATKPLYQQKVDRLVINVENSIVSAGGSALEILERSPGVLVNRQGNSISVVGKSGVKVMINGKESYVPASSLIQMLDGMSADNIESIELITTPPANFDAEGNAGFINIVLKKRTDLGLNGSYSLSGGYGEGAVTSDNINFNYRKNKINFYGSYSFSLDNRKQLFTTSREYMKDNNLVGSSTITNRDPSQRNHNLRLGLDYEISEKTIMGFIINGYDNKWTMDAFNESFDTENNIPISYVELISDELNNWKHLGANYNIKHNFTDDQFISFDIDYLYYKNDNPTDYTNSFFDENYDFLYTELTKSGKLTPIKTWVSKFDYSNQINDKAKIETGVKGTFSAFENDVSVENFDGINWIIDPTLTDKSNLDEKIFALYSAFDYKLTEKTSLKVGLRYEYTNSILDTETDGRVVDRQYGEFFPSIYLNRIFSEDLSMNLSYARRITRPTFNDLAPFVILFDPNTFISGNPALQPAISNSIKYDVNYKSIIFSLQYTNEDGSIVNFQERIDDETGRLIFEASNLDYTKTFSVTTGFPLKIADWWRTQNNFIYIYQNIRGFYDDEPVELSLGNFTVNTIQSFKITDTFTGEITMFYTSPSTFGTSIYDEVFGMNIGLEQDFGDKWGALRFSVDDVFNSVEFTGGTDLPDQNIKTYNLFDFSSRTFRLTYSRTFGNRKLKSSRERETGSEEERQRVE